MVKWFSKKQDESEVTPAEAPAMPPELSDYYQAERRERMWLTWLLSFAALAVTVVILFAVFLGGRWVYRRYVKNPETRTPNISVNETKPSTGTNGSTGRKSSDSGSQSTTPVATNNTTNNGSRTSSTNTSTSTRGSSTGNNTSLAQTGDSLPNTGPGDAVAVFTVTSALGTVVYGFINRKKR